MSTAPKQERTDPFPSIGLMGSAKDYRTWAGRHGKRLPLHLYPEGVPVHIVIGTYRRQPHFENQRLAAAVFALVERSPQTLAACLMPDHLDWLVSGDKSFSRAVQGFKSYSTRVAWNLGHGGRLWQRSFYDHVVRKEEGVVAVAAYILENPIRAGLVDDWRDYPTSFSRFGM